MIIAWVWLASVGMLIARYTRVLWEDKKLYGGKVWFQVLKDSGIFIMSQVGSYNRPVSRGSARVKSSDGQQALIERIERMVRSTYVVLLFHPGNT